jgi:hypothetical protein
MTNKPKPKTANTAFKTLILKLDQKTARLSQSLFNYSTKQAEGFLKLANLDTVDTVAFARIANTRPSCLRRGRLSPSRSFQRPPPAMRSKARLSKQ